MNRNNAIIAGIFSVAIAAALYWFFTNFERYEETISTGFQAEARRNPLLAVGRMLRTLGVDASEVETGTWMEQLGDTKGTLVLASRSWTLSETHLRALLQWISDGGHVVTAPETLPRPVSFWLPTPGDEAPDDEAPGADDDEAPVDEAESAGALLMQFGITKRVAPLSRTERAAAILTRTNHGELPVSYVTNVRLAVDHEDFIERASDEHGLCFIEIPYGRGRLSVLCSLNGLSNRWIDEHRNATFAWRLFDRHGDAAPVWFVFDTDMPPLYKWLWQNMPLAVIAALALLGLWLWSLARRSGPVIDTPATGSRRTLEHIDASGRFVWRYQPGAALLAGMREELRALIERRYPTWQQLPEAQLYQQLATLADIDPVRVFRALADTPRKRTHFISAVRDLQRLREIL